MYNQELEKSLQRIIDFGLEEDLGTEGDITSNATVSQDNIIDFSISNREEIILCGVDFALKIFHQFLDKRLLQKYKILTCKPFIEIEKLHNDGDLIKANSTIIKGKAHARIIFAAERLVLNLMQHLSGIATKTYQITSQIQGKTKILDTRKTIPTLRALQKYAVKVGGGQNHRLALYDAILIKDNHIAAAGGIKNAILSAKNYSNKIIEIECDNLDQVKEAVINDVDIIMLDNMSLEQIEEAIKIINNKTKIEVSGNMNPQKIAAISHLAIDYISMGSLTHSVEAVDIGLDIPNKIYTN